MEKMYHVGFDDTHGAKYVILPGDPGRVEKIAQFLDEPHFYCQHREYTTCHSYGGHHPRVYAH